MDSSNWNATRSKLEPLHQPAYTFSHVPTAKRDLKGSSLQRVTDREHLLKSMAEMLLLCKEATRRRPSSTTKGSASKPLSLEYMADRLDIDDPLFGYVVRTNENLDGHDNWKKGMLQGFITVTTFTNWQRTFRWDSSMEAAFEHDTEQMEKDLESGTRVWDRTNKLARELQSTVRFGNIWEEGVVWPRIAEISLLGALGCGRTLVSMVIEELECMKASGKANYDYVVLQATDNSIPFYESMGFVRVGAVTAMDEAEQNRKFYEDAHDSSPSSDPKAVEAVPDNSPEKPSVLAVPDHFVKSELTTYKVSKAGTTLADVAKRCRADVWDIIFLNKNLYGDLTPSSRLLADTLLNVPAKSKFDSSVSPRKERTTRQSELDTPQYYIAKENDTPRTIAKMFGVNCLDLVKANKIKLPGLISKSRLKNGTKIKVSHLDQFEVAYKPYAHWSFPDDTFEEGEPSYMMARKLVRRRGNDARERPFASSLAVGVSEYEPTDLLLPPSPSPVKARTIPSTVKNRRKTHPDEPIRPKKPMGSFFFFAAEKRQTLKEQFEGKSTGEVSKVIADEWKLLSEEEKAKYVEMAAKAKAEYDEAKEVFEKELAAFRASNPTDGELEPEATQEDNTVTPRKIDLFNQVVKLKPQAITEGSEYQYWYVLTYIPDLKWCHLAPMVQVGEFGPDKPKAKGRPKYMLVDESLGKEVDIGASYCIPIKARFMKRTLDADKEEWDVIDDGTVLTDRVSSKRRSSIGADSSSSESKSTKKQQCAVSRLLTAVFPGSSTLVSVRLMGVEEKGQPSQQQKRGRPKGSKNRFKREKGDASTANSEAVSAALRKEEKDNVKQASCRIVSTPPSRHTETPTTLSSASSLSTFNLEYFVANTKRKPSSGPIAKQPKKRSGAAITSAVPTKKRLLSPPTAKLSDKKALSPLTPGSSRKRALSLPSPRPSSKRARRSAAPRFLGESVDDFDDKSDKILYNPPNKGVKTTASKLTELKSPIVLNPSKTRPKRLSADKVMQQDNITPPEEPKQVISKPVATTNKRWHPFRETRNGKLTPRNRGPENLPSPTVLRSSPRILNARKDNLITSRPSRGAEKAKSKPTLYETISERRSVSKES